MWHDEPVTYRKGWIGQWKRKLTRKYVTAVLTQIPRMNVYNTLAKEGLASLISLSIIVADLAGHWVKLAVSCLDWRFEGLHKIDNLLLFEPWNQSKLASRMNAEIKAEGSRAWLSFDEVYPAPSLILEYSAPQDLWASSLIGIPLKRGAAMAHVQK